MTTFEIGKKYSTRSICNHDCVFVIEVVKRTAKTVTFRKKDGKERRTKIFVDSYGEYIMPDRYSMAPVFHAHEEYQEAPVVEAPTVEAVTVLAYIGQALTANYGAGCPTAYGTITGFMSVEATRFTSAHVAAMVNWEDGRTEAVALDRIHALGWRSPNGSRIGIFFAR